MIDYLSFDYLGTILFLCAVMSISLRVWSLELTSQWVARETRPRAELNLGLLALHPTSDLFQLQVP